MEANQRWNHNIHYHRVVHEALPSHAVRVLEVGCGEGLLTHDLVRRCEHVTAIDLDEATIDIAQAAITEPNVEFVVGDFMTYPFEVGAFDAIVSIASLHHMDEADALKRMASLVAPGGRVVVVGLAKSRTLTDVGWDLFGAASTRLHKLRRGYWETVAPKVWPPPSSYTDIRGFANEALPGMRYRGHPLWRYSLAWTKPPPLG